MYYSPLVKSEYNGKLGLENINRFNREAKINPDDSVLVEVRLTADQYELVKSGKYIVSLCDASAINGDGTSGDQNGQSTTTAPSLHLGNWKMSNGKVNFKSNEVV
jgi:hypothetical protein